MKKRKRNHINPGTALLIRQIIIGTLIVSFFGLLITTVWYVTRIPALTIDTIEVSGEETINPDELITLTRTAMDGTYLGLVPRAFAFTYPEESITESLKEVPRIKTVSVERTGGSVVQIAFEEYQPFALWCKDIETTACLFLDDEGYAYTTAPDLIGGSFVRFITLAQDPKERTQAFEKEQYVVVHELIDLLAASNWFVSIAEIDGAGDAYFTLVGGGEFKVSLRQTATETVNNLLTVLQSDSFSHIKPGNFEYIDLRFGSKVFVNEETIRDGETDALASEDGTEPSETVSAATNDSDSATAEAPEETGDATVATSTVPE
jgi:cell division septal protein FtsQ